MPYQPVRYQRYPIVVEAVVFDGTGECAAAIREWLTEALPRSYHMQLVDCLRTSQVLLLPTLEGPKIARTGDYIVKGMIGEIFPMSASDFEELFQPADEQHVEKLRSQFPRLGQNGRSTSLTSMPTSAVTQDKN